MVMRSPNWSSNVPYSLDLLRGHLRLFVGLLFITLALLVAVATIFLWPLPAAAILYVIYRVFGIHLNIAAALIGTFAIGVVWWWHMVRTE
jgi:hypothetical protein